MNRLFIAVSTAAFNLVTAESASAITAGAKESFRARYFNCLRLRKAAQLKTEAPVLVDSPVADEKGWKQDSHHSPLYDLAASNPHVIAATLFTRRVR